MKNIGLDTAGQVNGGIASLLFLFSSKKLTPNLVMDI